MSRISVLATFTSALTAAGLLTAFIHPANAAKAEARHPDIAEVQVCILIGADDPYSRKAKEDTEKCMNDLGFKFDRANNKCQPSPLTLECYIRKDDGEPSAK